MIFSFSPPSIFLASYEILNLMSLCVVYIQHTRDIQELEIAVPLANAIIQKTGEKSGLGFCVTSNLEIDGKEEITAEFSEDKATRV